jgi:hypothetical protein
MEHDPCQPVVDMLGLDMVELSNQDVHRLCLWGQEPPSVYEGQRSAESGYGVEMAVDTP